VPIANDETAKRMLTRLAASFSLKETFHFLLAQKSFVPAWKHGKEMQDHQNTWLAWYTYVHMPDI